MIWKANGRTRLKIQCLVNLDHRLICATTAFGLHYRESDHTSRDLMLAIGLILPHPFYCVSAQEILQNTPRY